MDYLILSSIGFIVGYVCALVTIVYKSKKKKKGICEQISKIPGVVSVKIYGND